MKTKIVSCWIKIVNPSGTYLTKGSLLPVYLDEDFRPFAVEEYEAGEPCEHYLDALKGDGVVFEKVPEKQVCNVLKRDISSLKTPASMSELECQAEAAVLAGNTNSTLNIK